MLSSSAIAASMSRRPVSDICFQAKASHLLAGFFTDVSGTIATRSPIIPVQPVTDLSRTDRLVPLDEIVRR